MSKASEPLRYLLNPDSQSGLLFDKDSYEIDEFFKEKRKQNLSDDEIIDLIENEIDVF